jgi:hypothetical protein
LYNFAAPFAAGYWILGSMAFSICENAVSTKQLNQNMQSVNGDLIFAVMPSH